MLHQELLEHFYHSFQSKNAEEMIACYHEDIVFTDPAFGTLTGIEAKNMWRMLLEKSNSIQIDYGNISADSNTGKAQYVFSKTNRPVINNVTSIFEFSDGKIIRQIDTFDLNVWAKQALGFQGRILQLFGILPNMIQRKSKAALEQYMSK